MKLTLGQTRTQQTGNLLDQTLGSKEGIVLASKLLDELLVLVQLLQVIGGHGIDAVVLGTVKIVLVTKNTVIRAVSTVAPTSIISPPVIGHARKLTFSDVKPVRLGRMARSNAPDAHARAGHGRQLDGARETLVTLGVIVLQTDLKLNGLEEVTLLLVERVVEKLLDILAHSGWEGVSEGSPIMMR